MSEELKPESFEQDPVSSPDEDSQDILSSPTDDQSSGDSSALDKTIQSQGTEDQPDDSQQEEPSVSEPDDTAVSESAEPDTDVSESDEMPDSVDQAQEPPSPEDDTASEPEDEPMPAEEQDQTQYNTAQWDATDNLAQEGSETEEPAKNVPLEESEPTPDAPAIEEQPEEAGQTEQEIEEIPEETQSSAEPENDMAELNAMLNSFSEEPASEEPAPDNEITDQTDSVEVPAQTAEETISQEAPLPEDEQEESQEQPDGKEIAQPDADVSELDEILNSVDQALETQPEQAQDDTDKEQPQEDEENDPLQGFSLEGLIDEPEEAPVLTEEPEEEKTGYELHPEESAIKNEIESLGRILEESLVLQEEIAHEKRLKYDPVIKREHRLSRLLIRIRWLMAGLGLVGMVYSFSLALFLVSGYIAVLNLLYVYQAENPKVQLLSFPVTFAADLINITILVHLTGEINSILFLLYFLLVAAITAFSPLLRALSCTGITAFVYVMYILGGQYEEINALGISLLRSLGIVLSSVWVLMLKYLAGYAKEHLLPEAAQIWNKKITLGAEAEQTQDSPENQKDKEEAQTKQDNTDNKNEAVGDAPKEEEPLS